jgi:hypothetical protein
VLVTNRQAKLTRRTADIAERALIDLERPILQIIEPFPAVLKPLSDEELGMAAHYKIANFGRTPATLHEISLQFGTWNERPEAPEYRTKVSLLTVIAQGETIKMEPHDLPYELEPGEGRSFVFGYLKYADIFGYEHTTGFGLRRHAGSRIWVVSGGPEYNYHRIDRKPGKSN